MEAPRCRDGAKELPGRSSQQGIRRSRETGLSRHHESRDEKAKSLASHRKLVLALPAVWFLRNALEGLVVLFDVDKLAGLQVPFHIFSVFSIEFELVPIVDRAFSVTFISIFCLISSVAESC